MFYALALPVSIILFLAALAFAVVNADLENAPMFSAAAAALFVLVGVFAWLFRKALKTQFGATFRKGYGLALALLCVAVAGTIASLSFLDASNSRRMVEGERRRLQEDERKAEELRNVSEVAYRQAAAQVEQTRRYIQEREEHISRMNLLIAIMGVVGVIGAAGGAYLAFISRPPVGLSAEQPGVPAAPRRTAAGWLMLVAGVIVLYQAGVIGVLAIMWGAHAFRASSEPEEISLKALIARGGKGNTNVIVTDFALAENFVAILDSSKNDWAYILVPVVPGDEVADANSLIVKNARAVLKSSHVKTKNELATRLNKPKVQGVLTDASHSALLTSSWPETNPAQCLIIDEGQAPEALYKFFLMGGGALLGLIAAVALLRAGWRRKA